MIFPQHPKSVRKFTTYKYGYLKMQALNLSLGYVFDIYNNVELESVPIREIPGCTASMTVQREIFKSHPERPRRTREMFTRRGIVPFWSSCDTPAFILLECLATSMRWLEAIRKLDQKLFGWHQSLEDRKREEIEVSHQAPREQWQGL